jgi:hypothetical protein
MQLPLDTVVFPLVIYTRNRPPQSCLRMMSAGIESTIVVEAVPVRTSIIVAYWVDRVVDLCMNTNGIIKENQNHRVFWLVLGISQPFLLWFRRCFITFRLGVFVWHEYTPQSLGLAMMTDEPCSILVFLGAVNISCLLLSTSALLLKICYIFRAVYSGQITKALFS